MALSYHQLDLDERRTIFRLLNAKVPVAAIARQLGRHRSTIHYEASIAIVAALQAGARGYLPTSLPSAVVAEAVRLIYAGGTYAPLRSLLPLRRAPPEPDLGAAPRPSDFSTRQLQILRCLCRGLSNKQIAFEVGVTEGTVKVHIRKLMRKVQSQNRTQLVIRTMSMQL